MSKSKVFKGVGSDGANKDSLVSDTIETNNFEI